MRYQKIFYTPREVVDDIRRRVDSLAGVMNCGHPRACRRDTKDGMKCAWCEDRARMYALIDDLVYEASGRDPSYYFGKEHE